MGRLEERAARREAWARPVAQVRYAKRHAAALQKLGVLSIGDLIMHLPFRHVDLSTVTPMSELKEGTQATVLGNVRAVREGRTKARRPFLEVALFDGGGYVFASFFNQPWVADHLTEGTRATWSGKVTRYRGRLAMTDVLYEVLEEDDAKAGRGPHAARIIPVHATTAGLSTTWLRRLVFEALGEYGDVPDPLPAGLRLKRGLAPLAWSLRQAHFPDDEAARARAVRRLAYEELFCLQVALAGRRRHMREVVSAVACPWPAPTVERYIAGLPFEPTSDQKRVLAEIGADLAGAHPMNRLLHGEVGSGKTMVACAALLAAVDAGAQGAMMAPTEVLAEQYAARIGPDLDGLGVRWAFLAGGTKTKERERILRGLAEGGLDVAFGTHALLEEDVRFQRLAVAVVDEQHRFGVRQRVTLAGKGVDSPHVLVMTATPIPRTLAMTAYGDLDVSVLRERPAGSVASRVSTRVLDRRHRGWAYDVVRREVRSGRQAYIVCPIVDPSDKVQVRSVTKEMDRLKDKEFWGLRLGLLHGRLSAAQKNQVMEAFVAGEVDVLVATTVIEVGVDVPNATVMIVEDAERFGLAQLHQLRGRVGRGEHEGFCLLFADPTTDEGRARMKAIEESSDGFELAELDLSIRGPGEVLGTRQSGMPDLRVARLGRDADLVSWAREDARSVVEDDPGLAAPIHSALAVEVRERFAEQLGWLTA